MALLVALGMGLCLHHGRVGFMPLDQSIVFDGAWRFLGGQKPFLDFVTPNGLVPMALQAGFFAVLGVDWFSYCLHAAVVNGLFCALAFGLLRLLGASPGLAFFYALATGVVFYPPFGVPFMDQHAFFFLLAAVVAALAGSRGRGSMARLAGVALPALLVLAFLSKQLPSALFPVAICGAFAVRRPRSLRALASSAALAALGCGLLLASAFLVVDAALVKTYALDLPAAVGRARLLDLASPAALGAAINEARRAWGMAGVEVVTFGFGLAVSVVSRAAGPGRSWTPAVLAASGALAYLACGPTTGRALASLVILGAGLVPSRRLDALGRVLRPALAPLVLAQALVVVCLLHALLTLNQPHNAIPFAFVALGLVHLGVLRAIRRARATGLGVVVTCALLGLAVRDAWSFEDRVNATRRVHRLDRAQVPVAGAVAGLPGAMGFMRWQTPYEASVRAGDVGELVAFLRRAPRNFLLLGDSTIVYALSGRPSVGPAVWYHPGLTYPPPGSAAFRTYESALLDSMARHDVGYVVLEGERTFMGAQLSDFPRLSALVDREACGRRRMGGFTVVTLCRP